MPILVRALLEAACCLIAHSILPVLKGVKHLSLPTGLRFFNIIDHNHHHFELSCFQAACVTLVVQEGIRDKSERNNYPLQCPSTDHQLADLGAISSTTWRTRSTTESLASQEARQKRRKRGSGGKNLQRCTFSTQQ